MKVIVPDTISLASTNVAANSQAIWSSAERYGVGDYVQYQGATPHKVYKSLRAYNRHKVPPDHTEVEEISTNSSSSVEIGTGTKSFTVRGDLNIAIGTIVTVAHAALPGSFSMTGEVTGYFPLGSSPSAGTPSRTASASPSRTESASPSGSPSRTKSASPSSTVSGSPSGSASATPSAGTPSRTPSATPSGGTPSGSESASPSGSASASPTSVVGYPFSYDPIGVLPYSWTDNGSPTYTFGTSIRFDVDEYIYSNDELTQVDEIYVKAKIDPSTLTLDASEQVKLFEFFDDTGAMAYVIVFNNGGTRELKVWHGSLSSAQNIPTWFDYIWLQVKKDSGASDGIIRAWINDVDDLATATGPLSITNGTGGDNSGFKNIRVGAQNSGGFPTGTVTLYSLELDPDQMGGSPSATVSTSPSASPSHTESASPSATVSTSPSASPSHTKSASPSATKSASPSGSASASATPSDSPSATKSGSPSGSPSATESGSPSASPSEGTEYDLVVNVLTTTGTGTFDTWVITNDDTVPFWEEIESTNQYKMFDDYVNSATTRTSSIEVTLDAMTADAVALFDVTGNSVTVEFWDAAESQLYYSETVSLTYGDAIVDVVTDWWEYFFGEYRDVTEVVVQSDVAINDGVVKIDIDQTVGIAAKCGNVVVGRMSNLGATRYGSGIGIIDYSRKETDEDGVISITEGYWAKEHNYTLIMKNEKMTAIYKSLANLRATPTAWVAADDADYDLFITYGILRDFSITVPGPTVSIGNLEIEGLT